MMRKYPYLFYVSLMVICIILVGCADTVRSSFEKAKATDTPETYLQFVGYWTLNLNCSWKRSCRDLIEEASSRLRYLSHNVFSKANVKTIEVRLLTFTNYLESGYKPYNRASMDATKLYENKFCSTILEVLKNKGYSVRIGDPIHVTIDSKSYYQDTYNYHDIFNSEYYYAALPSLKAFQKRDVDAILLFSVNDVYYRAVDERGYSFIRNGWGNWGGYTDTDDLHIINISYHLFLTQLGTRIDANHFWGERKSTQHQASEGLKKNLSPFSLGTFSYKWNYTENNDDFLNRVILSLMGKDSIL